MTDNVEMWTIVRNPADLPGVAYSARLWLIEPGGLSTATDRLLTAPTLDQLRAMLPPGLYRLDRFADDEAAIVETWL